MIGANAAEVTLPEPAPIVEPVTVSGADRVEKLPRIRRTIARRMIESLYTAVQFTTVVEVDVTRIARLWDREKRCSTHAQV
ncbi:Dihydrolipoamide acyltransferase component of branched-chain alpha-keto acid dehydrogenase complex [Rhodococcus wratislaviensis]|uniref:Dihydrolipoamide acyltransferase component of branched-chain alpha-keto acid dehydrogenase complex n=2 Tax=Rhodococcus TaxID=1827 RepID=A0A402CDF8_RHOWR|nr:2-oxo acid dehydrogenase subunit E2 [Rhodococcus wratislaviensis]GCE41630.1 Dihydrolipoamide acyltransferase component of branched-chain alpha-keto acid dehydrogenase complex [Rhodococcus wratislaviensis]